MGYQVSGSSPAEAVRNARFITGPFYELLAYQLIKTNREGEGDVELLVQALQSLSYRERELIKLKYAFGDGFIYTDEEFARIFKVSERDVKKLLSAAIRNLGNYVEKKKKDVPQ